MNKFYLTIFLSLAVVLAGFGSIAWWLFNPGAGANDQTPDLVETPPSINKVNALALGDRPFVSLVPHSDASRCNGVNLGIERLQNGEEKVEYELEYTTEKLIQGVFGRREFTQAKQEHAPLEFGTCSRGKCKCDDDITGGSLKLTFEGDENYTVKGDFSVQNVGEQAGKLTSRDVRLNIEVGDALPATADVMITSTFGLPQQLNEKVLLGPYGIFVEDVTNLESPMTIKLQSQDVPKGKVQFWDGSAWNALKTTVEKDVASFELESLGVIVLTE